MQSGHDALIVLGGGQNALDHADSPFSFAARADARFRRQRPRRPLAFASAASRRRALMAPKTFLAPRPSSAGIPSRAREEGESRPRCLPAVPYRFPIFHWHSDTFSLPEGATHLASSAMTIKPGLSHRPRRLRHPVPFRGRSFGKSSRWNTAFADYPCRASARLGRPPRGRRRRRHGPTGRRVLAWRSPAPGSATIRQGAGSKATYPI